MAAEIGSRVDTVTVRTREETTAEAAARTGNTGTLIAAGAWAGLDTPIQWRTIVIPRIPYSRPRILFDRFDEDDDTIQAAEQYSGYLDSRNAAARRLSQGFGRGLRRPDATCSVIICDPRIVAFEDVCPTRFRGEWHEGRKVEVVQTRTERNPRLRVAALRHYGPNCWTCGHVPVILREVEIHHLDPLADRGPAHTTMDEVAVLCRICHARAHADGNDVIALDRLREIAKEKTLTEKRALIRF